MPRLSLYRPEKSHDYDFLDKVIYEQFTVGGTDLFVHKYIGTKNPTGDDVTQEQPQYAEQDVTNIQDLLFLENRDRKYDEDIYTLRGHYNVQDQDFDLSQFGLFLSNDTLFLTIHLNSSVKTLGRKIISGDVIELPHLNDEYALNDLSVALKRFYVVEDVNRAAEGFSQTWYPHLYRLKLKQIYDSQEYKDILDLPAGDEENPNNTLRDLMSTYEREMQINNAVIAQAEENTPASGYDTSHFYTISVLDNGEVNLVTVDEQFLVDQEVDVSQITEMPPRSGYPGYLVGDGLPPNGAPLGSGPGFPSNSGLGDYFLRTDFVPNRLFRFDGNSWRKVEDKVRTTLTPNLQRDTLKGTFINNTTVNNIAGEDVIERQSLSKALRPKADN
jgi:hypothetical protein|tara:strand:+ start:122 stop:1279 length:1158 start_codon:yes stop_codon:yes gene_type:complete